ncbi:hypothetical protein DENSPDRAFT_838317 [Dentipellis sp. KUC8613]|nr:hypothetical protein DENSPDRAFT_838317 [Dentipellis sp. KUC8613]
MQPHQYLGTSAFPDVDFYRNQPASRSPSRTQHNNPYQQSPSRVNNFGSVLTGSSTYASAPTLYKSATVSQSHAPERSVTPEPWEASASEFQVSAYQHEMPVFHYESQFSVNPVHDSLRDTGPWIYNPEDDHNTRGPRKRQALRLSQDAVALREARAETAEGPVQAADENTASTRGKMKPRTAEQKERMAKSAANRRANDKNHLAIIKGKLPQLEYGQEYNNRTALAGAIARFERDEKEIKKLRRERNAIQERLNVVEAQLTQLTDKNKEQVRQIRFHGREVHAQTYPQGDLIVERDWLKMQYADSQAELDRAKATIAVRENELTNSNANLTTREMELHNITLQRNHTHAALQRTEAELRCYKDKYGPLNLSYI